MKAVLGGAAGGLLLGTAAGLLTTALFFKRVEKRMGWAMTREERKRWLSR